MSRTTISTFKLFELIPDSDTARKYLEHRLWKHGAKCPTCLQTDRVHPKKNGFYYCNNCQFEFTIRTATILERSHVPLHKWIYSMYLLITSRKGISSMQLAKEIGITQKSAWFLLQRLREACADDMTMLRGTVEVDEVYIGGKKTNESKSKRLSYRGTGAVGKIPVMGMRPREGRTRLLPIGGAVARQLSFGKAVFENIESGATVYTDEHAGYNMLRVRYTHKSINHSRDEFKRGDVTTNGIESVFALLRRGLHGIYHHASEKHLARYVNEFTWRLSEGNVRRHSLDRLDSFIDAIMAKRLTYKRLISKPNQNPESVAPSQ